MGRHKALVQASCKPGTDAEFNRWYDEIHIPEVLELTKMDAVQRFRVSDAQAMGEPDHRYLAIYEFDGDAREAVESLTKAGERFDMSDTLDSPMMVMYEAIGERVTKD